MARRSLFLVTCGSLSRLDRARVSSVARRCVSAKRVSAFFTLPSGSGASAVDGLARPAVGLSERSARGLVLAQLGDDRVDRRVRRHDARREGVRVERVARRRAVRGDDHVALDPLEQVSRCRVRLRQLGEAQQRQRDDAGAQVGAGHLAGLVGLRRQVDDVVDELERDADLLAELDDGLLERRVGASRR